MSSFSSTSTSTSSFSFEEEVMIRESSGEIPMSFSRFVGQDKRRNNQQEESNKGFKTTSSSHDLGKEQREMQVMDRLLKKNSMQLANLTEATGIPLTQENGQRRFGPVHGSKHPPKGTEVFVGKLPKFMNETHVYEVFQHAGQIYQIRLMLDFNGSNRGFCFVQYHYPEAAKRAIVMFNHLEICEGRRIGVTGSVDNCRLFLGGVPKDVSEQEIFEELARVTDNLVRVFAKSGSRPGYGYDSLSPKQAKMVDENRGFAFAEYASHRDAAMARRKMIPGKIPLWGRVIHVDWAEPDQPEVVNRHYGSSASGKTFSKIQQSRKDRYFQNFFEESVIDEAAMSHICRLF